MSDALEIPVTYKGNQFNFKAHSQRVGYVTHIIVDLNGTPITIERDEEGSYRALIAQDIIDHSKIDAGLVEALVDVFTAL